MKKDGAKLVYHIHDVKFEIGACGWLMDVRGSKYWPSLPDDCKCKLQSLKWWEDKKDKIEYSAEQNMQEVIAFMETHNRRPSMIAKDDREKYLGKWLTEVTTNEKSRTRFVKTMGEAAHTTILSSIDALFPTNLYPLRNVVEFVLENKRVPKNRDKGGHCLTNIRQGSLDPVHRALAISMVEEKLAGAEFDSARKSIIDSVELSFTNHAEYKRKKREDNEKRIAAKSTNPTGGTSTAPVAGSSGTKRSAPSAPNSSGKPPTKRGKTVLVE
jgi:hypothetical protein